MLVSSAGRAHREWKSEHGHPGHDCPPPASHVPLSDLIPRGSQAPTVRTSGIRRSSDGHNPRGNRAVGMLALSPDTRRAAARSELPQSDPTFSFATTSMKAAVSSGCRRTRRTSALDASASRTCQPYFSC